MSRCLTRPSRGWVYSPVDRVHYECPLPTRNPLREYGFRQPTAVSRFWLKLEGVAQGRLRTGFVEAVAKALGQSLLVVPEVIDDQAAGIGGYPYGLGFERAGSLGIGVDISDPMRLERVRQRHDVMLWGRTCQSKLFTH